MTPVHLHARTQETLYVVGHAILNPSPVNIATALSRLAEDNEAIVHSLLPAPPAGRLTGAEREDPRPLREVYEARIATIRVERDTALRGLDAAGERIAALEEFVRETARQFGARMPEEWRGCVGALMTDGADPPAVTIVGETAGVSDG